MDGAWLQAHIGVDASYGAQSLLTINQLHNLLHGEKSLSGDAGKGAPTKREELKGTDVEWLIAEFVPEKSVTLAK